MKIIIDGDWGGDEMQLTAVFLAHAGADILGATCVFGNTSHAQVLENAGAILRLLGADHKVHRYPGASGPLDAPLLEGDNAHGTTGIGTVVLPGSDYPAKATPAHDYIADTLAQHETGSITITATGPLTNLARAFRERPDDMRRAKAVYVMGGCTSAMPAHDMKWRQGNITPHAEFNFQQAAHDARTVMESGLPIVLFPMNCTHQLTLTPQRAAMIRARLSHRPDVAEILIGLISAPATLDRQKFDSDPVMHDVHTALYAVSPRSYEVRRGHVEVITEGERVGMARFYPGIEGPVRVAETIKHPDRLFGIVLDSFARLTPS